jgi:hypothetical protein
MKYSSVIVWTYNYSLSGSGNIYRWILNRLSNVALKCKKVFEDSMDYALLAFNLP